jgi:phenylpropionate dioxygenase-like ring-hydroxylating dioxygenase large terminal subunit
MDLRARLAALLAERRHGFSLPQAFYTDPAVHEADLEAIFYRRWLFAAVSCELAEPGAFVTLTVGQSPILVLRDDGGTLRAFFNTCRHRGARIVDAPRGKHRMLICPYHSWTYRLSGELARVRYMPEDFDRAEFSLRPVHVREVAGTVYVCLSDNPPDFTPFATALARQLTPHGLADAKLAVEVELIEHGNWKLVMENSRECYHCATRHHDLMRSLLDIYDFANPEAVETIGAYWAAWERAGLPAGVAEGQDFRAARLPLVNGARSMTIDGELAVKKPLGTEPPGTYGSLRWVHYPTTFNHAIGDYAVLIRMLPLGPQETRVTTKFLVARDAVEGVDYDVERLTQVWNTTNAEDKALVERNQAGVNSLGYRPGPYSPTLEAGIIKFVEWYCTEMQAHLGALPRHEASHLALAG